MTIVASQETRNSEWANNSFGRKMLEKMGWKGDGVGLGKNQQGTSTHLRAIKRAESLGIGAETDAFGDSGWQQTNAAFHGVLANLKKEHSNISSGSDDGGGDSKEARKKRKKEEKKRKKKEEKRRAKAAAAAAADGGGSSSASGSGIRLAQNKVQAGHARKMREAKDIRNKSSEDMAAIFGVKADFYKQPREWTTTTTTTTSEEKDAKKDAVTDVSREEVAQEEIIKERKKSKKSKEKKKRKHSSSSEEDTKQKKKKKSKK